MVARACAKRLNGEMKRRTEVVGISPNEAAITRLIAAILIEQNDEWAVQRSRYMTLESVAQLGDDSIVSLPTSPVDAPGPSRSSRWPPASKAYALGGWRLFSDKLASE